MRENDIRIDMPSDLHNNVSDIQPSPHGITSLTVGVASSYSPRHTDIPRPSPRWSTPEFFFYYVVALIVIPIMVWAPVNLSEQRNINYPTFQSRLSPGWLFGRQLDNSDTQYRSFRNNIPALSILAVSFHLIKSIYVRSALRSPSTSPSHRFHLIPFINTFSFLMLLVLHGSSIIKIYIILTINYIISKNWKGSQLGPWITWIFNVVILFSNEANDGYRFASLHPSLAFMDTLEGVYPRWHVSFNITMLRLVSFNMDYFWASSASSITHSDSSLTEKQRTVRPHPLDLYSYFNYLAYVLYPPLYIAGPIMTFNNFLWQIQHPLEIPTREKIIYFGRFVASLLTMELILHFMYVVAIKDAKAWSGTTPFELSMIGFWNLMIVWLKLLLPWRFFRLWALTDGIDPPENMIRCMANNYSTFGFWRSWHRSYNLWIIRYIYIPLGGTKNVAVTTALVFTFVALWHDLSFRLLAWGWLVSLFLFPELFASYVMPASKHHDKWWYRHVCAVGAVFNILMMMAANLVGFVIGIDGMKYMITQTLRTWEGLRFFIGACLCLFVGAQLMFEYREEEMREGIYRRC